MYARSLLSNLQPRHNEELKCVALMIYSSLQFQWFTVPCQHNLEDALIICQEYAAQPRDTMTPIVRQHMECPVQWVNIHSKCHRMVTFNNSEITCMDAIGVCHGTFSLLSKNDATMTKEDAQQRKLLFYYYQWLNRPSKESFYASASNADLPTRCLTLKMAHNPALVVHIMVNNTDNPVTTTAVCATDLLLSNATCLHFQFSCTDKSCILAHYACDGRKDCLDGSDEESCNDVCVFHHHVPGRTDVDNCYRDCFPTNCTCAALYYQCRSSGGCIPASTLCDGNADCVDGEDEMECYERETDSGVTPVLPEMFTCDNGTRLPQTRVNDLVPDCPGGRGEDEPRLHLHWSGGDSEETDSTGNNSCPLTYTQCIKGLPATCYPRHKICVYEVESETLYIKHCRNGAHLDNCSNHECPSMYKCSHSYCVPYHYVCNGRIDCPHGEDENHCTQLNCPGLLRCRYDGICVHPNNIGDAITDCLASNDDEALLGVDKCPKTCKCLGNAVTCLKLDHNLLKSLWHSIKKISIEEQIESNLCLKFPQLLMLNLSMNGISSELFPKFCTLPHLTWLSLARNAIHALVIDNFRGLSNLRTLELQYNPIQTIQPFSFSPLNSLRTLNLSHTKLRRIGQGFFYGLENLVTVDLSHNPITDLPDKGFMGIKTSLVRLHIVTSFDTGIQYNLLEVIGSLSSLENIHVYRGTFCLYAPANIDCRFILPVKDTCCKLINNVATELSMWFGGALLMLLHFFAGLFWIHTKAKNLSKVLMLIISVYSIGLSIYPLYILVVHNYYGSYFLLHQSDFVTTLQCNVVGKAFIWCHFSCLFTVLLTSHHRYILIAYPFKDINSSRMLYFGSLLVFTVTLLVVLASYDSIFGRAVQVSTCHIMPTDGKTKHWPYIFGMLLSSDCLLHGVLMFMYILTSIKLKSATSSGIQAHGNTKVKRDAYRRSVFFCAYEGFSLLVSCTVQALAVTVNYSTDGILASILALLLYELLNPVFYTFSTTAFLGLLCKHRPRGTGAPAK